MRRVSRLRCYATSHKHLPVFGRPRILVSSSVDLAVVEQARRQRGRGLGSPSSQGPVSGQVGASWRATALTRRHEQNRSRRPGRDPAHMSIPQGARGRWLSYDGDVVGLFWEGRHR